MARSKARHLSLLDRKRWFMSTRGANDSPMTSYSGFWWEVRMVDRMPPRTLKSPITSMRIGEGLEVTLMGRWHDRTPLMLAGEVPLVQIVTIHVRDELRCIGGIGGVAGRVDAARKLTGIVGCLEGRPVARILDEERSV